MHPETTDRADGVATMREISLRQKIIQALADRGSDPLRHVRPDVHEGRAILRGSVGCYYDKQLAQEVVKRIDGVEQLQNEIVVD